MTAVDWELSWGGSTDRGLRRAVNEDAYIAEAPIFFVADGMGGHEAGAEASRVALDGFRGLVGRPSVTVAEIETAYRDAVRGVASIDSDRFAAGTTLAGVAVCHDAGGTYWLVLNIGDSRTYRWARGALEQVSVDHSAVQLLLERGEIALDEAESHPQRNVVTRAVGAGSTGLPDYWMLPAAEGDRVLVCSDGLTKELRDDEIAAVLREEPSAAVAARRLVQESLTRGGRDNVTAVVVDAHRVVGFDDDPTSPGVDVSDDTTPRPAAPEEEHHAQL